MISSSSTSSGFFFCVCFQDWSLAVQGFLRAAESYKMADMLHSAAAALKQAGNHMIQSQQFSSDDITGVLDECLSLTHGISEPRILGNDSVIDSR